MKRNILARGLVRLTLNDPDGNCMFPHTDHLTIVILTCNIFQSYANLAGFIKTSGSSFKKHSRNKKTITK